MQRIKKDTKGVNPYALNVTKRRQTKQREKGKAH